MDGSNLCMTREQVFARTHAHAPRHASFDMAKALHASVKERIPDGESVFGEWLYAVHSIKYTRLPGYFMVFAVRDDKSRHWASWGVVKDVAKFMGMPVVPELWVGEIFDGRQLKEHTQLLAKRPSLYGEEREGVVVRLYNAMTDTAFETGVAKWVREGHVRTGEHWGREPIEKNQLGP